MNLNGERRKVKCFMCTHWVHLLRTSLSDCSLVLTPSHQKNKKVRKNCHCGEAAVASSAHYFTTQFSLWTWSLVLHINGISLSEGIFTSWNLSWIHQVELPHINIQGGPTTFLQQPPLLNYRISQWACRSKEHGQKWTSKGALPRRHFIFPLAFQRSLCFGKTVGWGKLGTFLFYKVFLLERHLQFLVLKNKIQDFPRSSVVKNSPVNAGDSGSILTQEDPLEKEMATHSSILAWKIPWTAVVSKNRSFWTFQGCHVAKGGLGSFKLPMKYA